MIITDRKKLEEFCNTLKKGDFVTVDTEFLRDKTYYPQLCLIQMAGPGVEAAAIDPMAPDIDLAPLYDLLFDSPLIKVFHAARQDLETFYNLTGKIPHPLFDTQVAAMVCGHGEQVGYNSLVQTVCGRKLDKGAQFTDWSRRPLSARQMNYALDDVTYLRDIYNYQKTELERSGRTSWLVEEMEILTSPSTYENAPDQSWQRIKIRSDRSSVLAVLREIAAWREKEAQRRNVPRNRVIRDETLADMAVHAPHTVEELAGIRGVSADMARGRMGTALLEAVKRGLDTPKDQRPRAERREALSPDLTPTLEMLKMLLRICSAENAVAPKLVASSDDLEILAARRDDVLPLLKGWRRQVFGARALDLMEGRISLSLRNGKIIVRDELPDPVSAPKMVR